MKVLVMNGSPKGDKSNTLRLTRAFLDGMHAGAEGEQAAKGAGAKLLEEERKVMEGTDSGDSTDARGSTDGTCGGTCPEKVRCQDFETRELVVSRLDIRPCRGCFSCWDKTPGRCCIPDDMGEVIADILWADVIIWSFPLYYYSVPGDLKNLIDRQLPMELPFMVDNEEGTGSGSHPSRYDMSGKQAVVISTCGFYSAEKNYDGVHSLFDHMYGKNRYTAIFCGQGELFRVPELSQRTDEYLGYVRQAGEEFASSVISTKEDEEFASEMVSSQTGGESANEMISPQTRKKLNELLYPKDVFERMADASWGLDRETGERESDALIFTRQMAALYRTESYTGKDFVLEMDYTDIGECYQIVLGKEGSEVFTDGLREADTRIETPISLWKSIAAGEIRGDEALMKHLYRVKGDFNLMINWGNYFMSVEEAVNAEYAEGAGGVGVVNATDGCKEGMGSETHGVENGTVVRKKRAVKRRGNNTAGSMHMPRKETNMSVMLTPWIVFWTAVSINGFYGALVVLGACALTMLLFFQNKKTIYDMLSIAFVTAFCIASLLGASRRVVVCASYFTFGLMWTVTCFGKIPLTAHYSMNDYHGESMLENPLFIKTNWILTLMWGVLYLLTPIWTYFIMGTGIGGWIGAINSILPCVLGIFTAWFQKWYPARIARG